MILMCASQKQFITVPIKWKKKKKTREFIIITPKIIIIIIIKQNTESLSKNNNAIGANFVSKVLFYYLYRFNLVLN